MKFLLNLLLLVSLLFSLELKAQSVSNTFLQEIKTDVVLPPEAGKTIIKLFKVNDKVVVVTSNGVFRYADGKWSGQSVVNQWITATLDEMGNVWLASTHTIQQENKKSLSLPSMAKNDTIFCLYWENDKTLHVGTTKGLWTLTDIWRKHSAIHSHVNAITFDAQNQCWVATNDGLWRRRDGHWVNMDETMMDRANGRTYLALEQQMEGNELLVSTPISIGCISEAGNHWVLRAADGLPFGPITSIKVLENTYWFGTKKGAIKKDSSWHYYLGKRWMPDNQVNDILPIDKYTVWIATPQGVSQIKQVEMSLEQKADSLELITELRHQRRGLINHSKLRSPGDLSTSFMENEDNDGLWTSCYLAAECFKYGTTKSSDARLIAIRTFEALERLETVTGISGYPARSYALSTDMIKESRSPHPKKWHPSPDGKWQWLDDTSSDEIVGHVFSIGLFHDLVADDSLKERAKKLIERIMTHIVDNNFHLIDFDGKPTRWGIWSPDSLNHSKNWMFERGLNSLQILSNLKTAIHLTGNPAFEKAYQDLIEKHGYAKNAVQAKIHGLFETSHSDDILNFFPYYNLLRYSENDKNLPLYEQSLARSWQIVRSDQMPVWNVIASILLKKDGDIHVARKELEEYPIDLVNWTMENSHRWDLQIEKGVDRFQNMQSTRPVPTPEANVWRWNTNPRQLNVGLQGLQEEDGSYFLLAYWMGRYHGLWEK